jgi:hypothetical protein
MLALEIAGQVGAGLAAVHQQNLVFAPVIFAGYISTAKLKFINSWLVARTHWPALFFAQDRYHRRFRNLAMYVRR